jgi:hypothetical protein
MRGDILRVIQASDNLFGMANARTVGSSSLAAKAGWKKMVWPRDEWVGGGTRIVTASPPLRLGAIRPREKTSWP